MYLVHLYDETTARCLYRGDDLDEARNVAYGCDEPGWLTLCRQDNRNVIYSRLRPRADYGDASLTPV